MTGPELRRFRQARGLTMQQVADEAGVTKSYISLVETGHRSAHGPSIEIYVRLLNAAERLAANRDSRPADLFEARIASSVTGWVVS